MAQEPEPDRDPWLLRIYEMLEMRGRGGMSRRLAETGTAADVPGPQNHD